MVISYKLPRVQEDTIMPQLRLERIQQGGHPSRRCRSLVTGSNRRWAALRLCGFAALRVHHYCFISILGEAGLFYLPSAVQLNGPLSPIPRHEVTSGLSCTLGGIPRTNGSGAAAPGKITGPARYGPSAWLLLQAWRPKALGPPPPCEKALWRSPHGYALEHQGLLVTLQA